MDESPETKELLNQRELTQKLSEAANAISVYNRRKWDIESDIRNGEIDKETIIKRISQSEDYLRETRNAQDGSAFSGTWIKLEEFWGEELEKWKNHDMMK